MVIGDIKEDIIKFYNKAFKGKLGSDSEALDIAIQLCLNDLSTSLDALIELDDSQVLEVDTDFISYPTDFKELVDIVLINSNSVRGDPLFPLKNGVTEYDRLIESPVGSGIGTPEFYVEYDGGFYIYPVSSGDFDVEIKHYRYHPTGDLSNILFDKFFTDCIKFGTVFYEAFLRSNPKYISTWGPAYSSEKEKCRLLLPDEPAITGR